MSIPVWRSSRLVSVLLAWLAGAGARALAQDAASAQAAREWNQPRGDADLSGACDVEPILRSPLEAWRIPFKELFADPVCWGGLVFVAGVQQRDPALYVYDLKTGKSAATSLRLTGGKPQSLAVWQGFVALVQSDGVQIVSLRGGQFANARKLVPVANPGPASVLAGQLFVCDRQEDVHCIDLDQAKDLGRFSGGQGQPAVVALDGARHALVASVTFGRPEHPDPNLRYVGQYLSLETCDVQGLGTATPKFVRRNPHFHSLFHGELGEQQLAGSVPIAIPVEGGAKEPAWVVFSTQLLETKQKGNVHAAFFPGGLFDFSSPPVALGGCVLGFAGKGELVRVDREEKSASLFPQSAATASKRRCAGVTRARGVLYLENWAVRLEDARVLWELPDLDLARGLWPVGDGLALYVSPKNELVCLRDPGSEPAAAAAAPRKPARPSLPGSGEGLVLRDGTRLAGSLVRAADGSVELKPEHGEVRHFSAAEIALLETPEGIVRTGPEVSVYRAAAAACSFELRESLAPQIELYLQAGLVDEARALANLQKEFGATPAEQAQLDQRLSGRSARDDRNAARLHEGGQKEETRLREKAAKRFEESARWCAAHGLPLAASVLYSDTLRAAPELPGIAAELAPLVPGDAPWSADADAAQRWMALARELLPSDASVVPADDALWKRLAGTCWATHTLALRSPNLELVSRELDPRTLGRALHIGEHALEMLQHLLGEGAGSAVRLDVRLHASQADYQAELKQATGVAYEWMGGHYSGLEHVSRFFVARDGRSADLPELERVLAHELAHHFIDLRWAANPRDLLLARGGEPGFWISEGLAEFVSGQVLEMDRLGERLDDAEVVSVDACAQIAGERLLIPIERLLELDQAGFWKLADKPLAGIQLQHSLRAQQLTERVVFYQESAALVFYLLNEAGAPHAARVPEYLRQWNRNELTAGTWKALGYATPEELASGFTAFLEKRRQR